MPMYDFKCETGHRFERMVPLAEFHQPQPCLDGCNHPTQRLISAPLFTVDQTGYHCPITDKWIGSKREHRNNLDQHGCRVLETGERELNEKRRQQSEAEFDKTIENSVERELAGWGSDKLESLSNELVNGKVDLALERGSPNV